MKNLILPILLFFISYSGYSQVQQQAQATQVKVQSSSYVENELVLSNEKTTIKTPLTVDLNNYTHLLIVNSTLGWGNPINRFGMDRIETKKLENLLSLTVFEIMNPYTVNKSRAKKEPTFLKTLKDESYLYLYIRQGKGRGDDVNTSIIIRDWNNKIIYNASHINTGLNEILSPLIDY